jgi:hypothetical protein
MKPYFLNKAFFSDTRRNSFLGFGRHSRICELLPDQKDRFEEHIKQYSCPKINKMSTFVLRRDRAKSIKAVD